MVYTNISNHQVPDDTHDYYTVSYADDDILTLLTASPAMVDSWISEILHIHRRRLHRLVVGLDIEWRPNSGRQYNNPAATLQLCVGRRCLVFQLLYAPYIPQSLIDFLDDQSFTFVGVGIDQDAQRLFDEYDLNVANAKDLRNLAADRMIGREDLRNAGLARLASEVVGTGMNKPINVRLSCWDDFYLNPDQVLYATVDAFVSFEIGRILTITCSCSA